jgi:two-component system sensor histidine kinase KdpD
MTERPSAHALDADDDRVEGDRVDPDRPTGDQMLARTRAETRGEGRGHLRLYVGMAPGVGKTYRMLEEAHRRAERGTDVIVGFVETYGRRNTAALLDGLEIVPRARFAYRGVTVEEMDTAAVIARRPAVALVDELAHTNAPGSPREKRWQDVDLLRDAGIDVISTCNVQHIESIADAVETILGVPVRERVPDEVVREAEEIELVDMTPRALRQRMRHGNVYPPDRTAIALDRFFTEANLTALRELSLRFVTGQVDDQLEDIVEERGLAGLPPVSERVLVLIDERPAGRRALRRGAAIASALRAQFMAAAIQTPAVSTRRDRALDLQETADYAVDLGAEVVPAEADDVAAGLEAIVRERRVTHLVLVQTDPGPLDRLRRRSLADTLLARLPGLEIHLVSEDDSARHDRSG